MTICHGTDG